MKTRPGLLVAWTLAAGFAFSLVGPALASGGAESEGEVAQVVVAGPQTGRALATAGLVAVVLRFLMMFAARAWPAVGAKRNVYRWAALVVGLATFALERFAAGTPWQDAIVAAIGGPGAVLVHEFTKMRSSTTRKAVRKPAETPPPSTPPSA